MADGLLIRDAEDSDAGAIAEIYAHHVLHGTASYDEVPPTAADTLAKLRRINEAGWPFIVAELDGRVVGYAYATQFRDRPAYRFTAENSIYVDAEFTGRGIGKAVLTALIERSCSCGFRTIIAVIGGGEPASVALHAALGFEEVGRLRAVGWKHGRCLDSVYMQLGSVREPIKTS